MKNKKKFEFDPVKHEGQGLFLMIVIFFGGIRAILATIDSISLTPMVFLLFVDVRRCWAAPASSMTSIALSGSFRSVIYRAASSTADFNASAVYFIL